MDPLPIDPLFSVSKETLSPSTSSARFSPRRSRVTSDSIADVWMSREPQDAAELPENLVELGDALDKALNSDGAVSGAYSAFADQAFTDPALIPAASRFVVRLFAGQPTVLVNLVRTKDLLAALEHGSSELARMIALRWQAGSMTQRISRFGESLILHQDRLKNPAAAEVLAAFAGLLALNKPERAATLFDLATKVASPPGSPEFTEDIRAWLSAGQLIETLPAEDRSFWQQLLRKSEADADWSSPEALSALQELAGKLRPEMPCAVLFQELLPPSWWREHMGSAPEPETLPAKIVAEEAAKAPATADITPEPPSPLVAPEHTVVAPAASELVVEPKPEAGPVSPPVGAAAADPGPNSEKDDSPAEPVLPEKEVPAAVEPALPEKEAPAVIEPPLSEKELPVVAEPAPLEKDLPVLAEPVSLDKEMSAVVEPEPVEPKLPEKAPPVVVEASAQPAAPAVPAPSVKPSVAPAAVVVSQAPPPKSSGVLTFLTGQLLGMALVAGLWAIQPDLLSRALVKAEEYWTGKPASVPVQTPSAGKAQAPAAAPAAVGASAPAEAVNAPKATPASAEDKWRLEEVARLAAAHPAMKPWVSKVQEGTWEECGPLVSGRHPTAYPTQEDYGVFLKWLVLDPPHDQEVRRAVPRMLVRVTTVPDLIELCGHLDYPGSPNASDVATMAQIALDMHTVLIQPAERGRLKKLGGVP